MKKLLFLLSISTLLVATTTSCKKEHITPNPVITPLTTNVNDLDGAWQVLEAEHTYIIENDTVVDLVDYRNNGAKTFLEVTADSYEIQGSSVITNNDTDYYLYDWEEDVNNSDPEYKYWIWIKISNPTSNCISYFLLAKPEQ